MTSADSLIDSCNQSNGSDIIAIIGARMVKSKASNCRVGAE